MSPEKNNYPTKFDNTNFYGFVLLLIMFSLTFLTSFYLYVSLLVIGLVLIARGSKLKRKILKRRYDYFLVLLASVVAFAYIFITGILFSSTPFSPPCYEGMSAFQYKLQGLALLFYLLTSLVSLAAVVFHKSNKVIRISRKLFFLSIIMYSLSVIFYGVVVFIFGDTYGQTCFPLIPTTLLP